MGVHDIEADEAGFDAVCDKRIRAILDFVGGWERAAPILIHCYAGISRSTATAFITACAHNPACRRSGDRARAARRLAHRQPQPPLHRARRRRAGTRRAHAAAIESIGRGGNWYEIGEAEPFTLPRRAG